MRGVLDASALACRGQASLRLGAQGGMLSMRAGVMGGKGPRGRAGAGAGNDRLAWRAPQASSGRGGQAGQPGRLRCLFAKRLRRERRRGAGAGIVRLGLSIVLRCRVQADEAEGLRLRWPASLSMAVAAAHRRGMLERVAGQVWAAAQHGGPRGIAGSKAGPGGSPVSTAAAVRLRGVQGAAAGVWRGCFAASARRLRRGSTLPVLSQHERSESILPLPCLGWFTTTVC
ncbi:MAG: hypothetical protein WCE63_05910 [Acidobacteriaceae bacterium]